MENHWICTKPSWNWPSISRFGRMNIGNHAQRLNAFCNTSQVMVLWYSSCFLRRSSSAFFLSSSFFLFSSSFFSFCSSSKYKERFFGHQCFAAANWHAERVLPHLSWTSYKSKHMLTEINQLAHPSSTTNRAISLPYTYFDGRDILSDSVGPMAPMTLGGGSWGEVSRDSCNLFFSAATFWRSSSLRFCSSSYARATRMAVDELLGLLVETCWNCFTRSYWYHLISHGSGRFVTDLSPPVFSASLPSPFAKPPPVPSASASPTPWSFPFLPAKVAPQSLVKNPHAQTSQFPRKYHEYHIPNLSVYLWALQ